MKDRTDCRSFCLGDDEHLESMTQLLKWQRAETAGEAVGSATTRDQRATVAAGAALSKGGGATLIKRSFSLTGHRTSVALEREFWAALMHIAASRRQTVTALVAETDAQRPEGWPLASALRVLALQAFFAQHHPNR
jgi:predicted DNA-binding ribbon-helix-helix protein